VGGCTVAVAGASAWLAPCLRPAGPLLVSSVRGIRLMIAIEGELRSAFLPFIGGRLAALSFTGFQRCCRRCRPRSRPNARLLAIPPVAVSSSGAHEVRGRSVRRRPLTTPRECGCAFIAQSAARASPLRFFFLLCCRRRQVQTRRRVFRPAVRFRVGVGQASTLRVRAVPHPLLSLSCLQRYLITAA